MPFRYTPLNNPKSDLRVITIQCGQISDSVRCILTEHAMPALKYQYQALSYTWGDERRKVPIIIDGEEFLVTPNLEDALRHLRRSTLLEAVKQLPVWIDAICINQEDSEERDAQVRRMKSIYEQAEQVVIWLGNYNEPSDETFRLNMSKWKMDRVEDNSEALARSAIVLLFVLKEEAGQQQSSELSIGLEDCQHSNNMHVWLQLSRLLYRPWFERLWVIQELAVSRKAIVQWGNLQTAWSTLEKAAKFILRPGEAALPQYIRTIFPLLGAHRVTQVALESMFNFDTQNILTILHNTQNSKCSDPRDRLYAIQGIVEDNQDIEIDYSIPVQQVYRNWAVKRIRRTKTLDIFSACADSSRGGDLPSWVPDFREPFGQDKPLWIASQTLAKQSYGRMMQTDAQDSWGFQYRDLRFSEDGLKLCLSGKYAGEVDNLTTVGDAATDLRDPAELQDRLKQIIANWETKLNEPRDRWGDESLPAGETEVPHAHWLRGHEKMDQWMWSAGNINQDAENLDIIQDRVVKPELEYVGVTEEACYVGFWLRATLEALEAVITYLLTSGYIGNAVELVCSLLRIYAVAPYFGQIHPHIPDSYEEYCTTTPNFQAELDSLVFAYLEASSGTIVDGVQEIC